MVRPSGVRTNTAATFFFTSCEACFLMYSVRAGCSHEKAARLCFLLSSGSDLNLGVKLANLAPIPPNRSNSRVVRSGRVHQCLNESLPLTLRQSQNLVFAE